MTRSAFDLISVFGSLGARVVPGPVFSEVLGARGYSPSNVRNQLVRMVDRSLLLRERSGRTALYRRAASLDGSYTRMAGDAAVPEWSGSFAALIVTIPESRRSDRDRVLYTARFFGYRQLRGGVLIGFTDASVPLLAELRSLPASATAGVEPCRLSPQDHGQARQWVRRAFGLPELGSEIAALGQRVTSAWESPDLTEAAYFDLFYDLSLLALRLPAIPAELLGTDDPSPTTLRSLMSRTVQLWGVRLADAVFTRVLAHPSAQLLEFDPDHWRRIGLPVPEVEAEQ